MKKQMVEVVKGRFKGKIGEVVGREGQWVLVKVLGDYRNDNTIFLEEEVKVLSRSKVKKILKPKKKEKPHGLYVNVYRITREYGGPEEGGWYYNYWELVESRRFPLGRARFAERVAAAKEDFWGPASWGSLSSVLGGEEYEVRIERKEAASETTYIPRYC